jgi:uncharacterized cupin superfamily protein
MGIAMPMKEVKEISKIKIDPEAKVKRIVKTLRGDLHFSCELVTPQGMLAVEDFASGETIRWIFFHDEWHYILKGKAELTYSLPPWHDEQKTMTVEAGEAYFIPCGADITFKIVSKEPYRKMLVVMPPELMYKTVEPRMITEL